VLVDTDVIVDHLRGLEGAKNFLKRVEKKEFRGYFSTITEAELFSGKRMNSKDEQRKVSALLGIMDRVPVNSTIARKAGEIRRNRRILLPDALIAATAFSIKAKLATKNVKHFEEIKEVKAMEPY
jgi:predicted nucleic acid-binding protein